MRDLRQPSIELYDAWQSAHAEWGPGRHEDGFGLRVDDCPHTPDGFAAWVHRLQGDQSTHHWWIVEDGDVLGGIALRLGPPADIAAHGHVGYGVRPAARGRGIASWALRRVLDVAADHGLPEVIAVCEDGNAASVRVLERCGGRLDGIDEGAATRLRRYRLPVPATRCPVVALR